MILPPPINVKEFFRQLAAGPRTLFCSGSPINYYSKKCNTRKHRVFFKTERTLKVDYFRSLCYSAKRPSRAGQVQLNVTKRAAVVLIVQPVRATKTLRIHSKSNLTLRSVNLLFARLRNATYKKKSASYASTTSSPTAEGRWFKHKRLRHSRDVGPRFAGKTRGTLWK
jgi:hypothetical protein